MADDLASTYVSLAELGVRRGEPPFFFFFFFFFFFGVCVGDGWVTSVFGGRLRFYFPPSPVQSIPFRFLNHASVSSGCVYEDSRWMKPGLRQPPWRRDRQSDLVAMGRRMMPWPM